MKKLFLSVVIGMAGCVQTYPVLANDTTIDSVDVVQRTLSGVSNCMHYKVTGLCFWWKCSVWGCGVHSTLKLDQYLPDTVVSVYTQPKNNPFSFAQTIDPAFYQAGQAQLKQTTSFNMGFGDQSANDHQEMNNKFHEVDIIGNPVLTILSGYGIFLPSAATPYVPYYSSLLDAYAWRFPAAERVYPGSMIPGLHEVGTLLVNDWGPVYPRNGYVNQPDDVKAAAVNALRASTIITTDTQPHLYQRLSNSCGSHCNADVIVENSPVVQYQLIYPNVENQCVIFGSSTISNLQPWEADAPAKGDDRYVWVLWRHYEGCIQGSGHYIGSVDF